MKSYKIKDIPQELIEASELIAKEKLKKIPSSLNVFREASEQGALFGSVTARDIAHAIQTEDLEINAKDIILKSIIKNTGEYQIKLVLHPEVSKEIAIKVEKSQESPKN